jgi:hypothetical protein
MNTVYKYLDASRITYFEDEYLRFTQPSDLNDPYECIPLIKDDFVRKEILDIDTNIYQELQRVPGFSRHDRRHLKQIKPDSSQIKQSEINEYRERLLSEIREYGDTCVGIFSVSRKWNNSLMWAHYTKSHKGFCIGFDRNHEFFTTHYENQNLRLPLTPVEYKTERFTVDLALSNNSWQRAVGILTRKSIDWEYEQEERIVSSFKLDHITKSNNHGLPINLFKVPHDAINEIVTGINASQSLQDLIGTFCKKRKIKLYKCKLSKNSYDFERDEIYV